VDAVIAEVVNARHLGTWAGDCDGDRVSLYEDGDCSFQLMVDRDYIPAERVLAAARSRGLQGDALASDLVSRISVLQNTPEGCSRARRAYFPNHGAAGTMIYLVLQLKRGLRDQRPVVFTGKWIYAGCPTQDISCVFLSESVCNFSDIRVDPERESEEMEARDWAYQSHGVHEALGGQGRGGVYPERMQEVDPDFVLPLYKAEGKGMFWYNSIFTGYVFRLVLTLAARVDEEMQHLGLASSPFVGVHIRRGDACGQNRPCIDIHMYSDAVVRMCETYGISLVYLATDDPHALPELQEALHLHSTSIKVVGQRLDRQFMVSNTEQCGALANEGIGGNNPGMGCEWIESKLLRASPTKKLARIFDYLF
jgi:hypothetical protein